MALEEQLEQLREATLRRLPLEPSATDESFEAVATVLGPREEPLDGPMLESLASHLAVRLTKEIQEKTPEGRSLAGIARSKVDYSDDADCEGTEGEQVNAFHTGERCCRIVLRVATVEA